MSEVPQMDIRASKYLVKTNAETTRYFTQEPYDIDSLEQQVNQNSQDISNLDTRVTNVENRLLTDESDIDNLQSDVSNLITVVSNIPINPYEGLLSYSYVDLDATIINYNNNQGNMIIWNSGNDNIYMTDINNIDTNNNVEISDNIKHIVLPGIVKKINQDNSINKIIDKIRYALIAPASNRKTLNSLTTITILPDVYSIEFNLTASPNLKYFYIFEGLQILKLSNGTIPHLKIPSSVVECEIINCSFYSLTFEGANNNLKLTYTDVYVKTKLKCSRELTYNSSINVSNISNIDYPSGILECNVSF